MVYDECMDDDDYKKIDGWWYIINDYTLRASRIDLYYNNYQVRKKDIRKPNSRYCIYKDFSLYRDYYEIIGNKKGYKTMREAMARCEKLAPPHYKRITIVVPSALPDYVIKKAVKNWEKSNG